MKTHSFYGVMTIIVICLIFVTCKKNDPSLSAVKTLPVIYVSSTAATIGIHVETDGGSQLIECGIYIATFPDPERSGQRIKFSSDTGIFYRQLSGLTPEVKYYVKSYAQNEGGESLGNQVDFSAPGIVKDFDNNTYETVKIENQVWMASNLKTLSYRNGDPIETTNPATADITGESTPKYQWAYEGDEVNAHTYGRLYTGYTVTDTRGVCPTGWHVPTDSEFTTLIATLGNNDIAGGSLKETGTTHWDSPNTEATNLSLFTGLPGGGRRSNGDFSNIALGQNGWWWTSTFDDISQLSWMLRYDNGVAGLRSSLKAEGFSVRCVKD